MKLKENYDLYDIDARNVFVKSKVTTSIIKCANGVNPYRVRNNIINQQICRSKCPRYSEVEIWEYVIKCKETILLRREFVKKLLKELNENCPNNVE